MDEKIYGKPVDAADAERMLVVLRGRSHQVLSAVSVLELPTGRQRTRANVTNVAMCAYSDEEIAAYIDSGDPLTRPAPTAFRHRCLTQSAGSTAAMPG